MIEKNRKFDKRIIWFSVSLVYVGLVLVLCWLPGVTEAAGASLYLSPSTGNHIVGSTFTVKLKVNSGGVDINAAEAILTFNTDELNVINISETGSIFSLWPVEPTYSNSDGTIEFSGGTRDKFNGTSETIVNITFKVLTSGSTQVSFSSGRVLAADGVGTNILDTASGGTYTLKSETAYLTISNVEIIILSSDGATIAWETDIEATSQVEYGTSIDYGYETTIDETLTINHLVSISGLSPTTTYHYRVKSKSASGYLSVSSDYSFTTPEEGVTIIRRTIGDVSPPIIMNIEVSEITKNSAKISWTSDKPANSIVTYGRTSDYGFLAGDLQKMVTNHTVELTNLIPGTTYHYQINSYDDVGNKGTFPDQTFTTLREGEIPGEQEEEEGEEEEEEIIIEAIKKASRILLIEILKALLLNPNLPEIPEGVFTKLISTMGLEVVSPPVIFDIRIEVGADWAKVSWRTDKESNSILAVASDLEYDPTRLEPYTIMIGNPDEQVLMHEVELTGLKPENLYHYEVRSKSPFSKWGKSGDRTLTTSSLFPEIYEVKFIEITEKDATLSWVTTLPTKTIIEITDMATGAKTTQEDKSYLKEHVFTVRDLRMSTNYTLQIFAEDENGRRSFSSILPFSTLISLEPPTISQVRISTALIPGRIEKVQTIISWKTDKPATSRIYFEEGIAIKEELALSTPLDKKLILDHIVITTALKPGRVYRLRAESIDASGNVSYSKDFTILTPRPTESIIDLIIKNLGEIFGFLRQVRF